MFAPRVEVQDGGDALLAEFWDCHRLDPKPVQELGRLLDAHLARGGAPVLLVDLAGVGFAGSAALGGFLGMRKRGVQVIFYQVEPAVREVFVIARLDAFFQFAVDRAEARARIRRSSPHLVVGPGDPAEQGLTTRTEGAASDTPPPLRRPRRPLG
ncbi:MAG: hypothetical protein KatS3mg108_1812 [Isosphaeraceae bacterium]|jgi:anti-anti-sigma factor|nr:MAG: hypothetical protein KatS3mg108_1812 [Isosphaeraceae bacterium]